MEFMLRSFSDFFANGFGVPCLICIAVGLAILFSSRNITRAVRKTKDISFNDGVYITWFIIGCLIICAGVVLMVLAAK